MCLICGWIYDESVGDPDHGVAPGTRWADVPMNWTCPECGARIGEATACAKCGAKLEAGAKFCGECGTKT